VLAFLAADPPPPAGTGRPVAVASVFRPMFTEKDSVRTANFSMQVPAGEKFIISGLYDVDSNFSLFVEIAGQATLGDLTSSTPILIDSSAGDQTIDLALDKAYASTRPSFAFEEGVTLNPHGISKFTVKSTHIPRIHSSTSSLGFNVVRTATEADGDNLADMYPKVILTKINSDSNHTTKIIIPTVINPFRFLPGFGQGAPFIQTTELDLIVPPVALTPKAEGGWTTIRPIPEGQYQVNLINDAGQTWSVPNTFNASYGRTGTPLEDPAQDRRVAVPQQALPAGEISGTVTLVDVLAPQEDFSVVVTAFDINELPPPTGSGRPKALAILTKEHFAGGNQAPFTLQGLPTGDYQVRAFLDANDDFVLWFDTHNQPNKGDVGGGYFSTSTGGFATVSVDALAAPVQDTHVSILAPLTLGLDRPIFEYEANADLEFSASSSAASFSVKALSTNNDVLKADGLFLIQWVDRDGNGMADDVNGDGQPDLYPLVVVEWLDETDPSNLSLNPDHRVMSGIVPPAQFLSLGFPAGDPSAVQSIILASELSVTLPLIAVDPAVPGSRFTPPSGRYRITLIQATGQTWTIPNDLQQAQGTDLAQSQAQTISILP